MPCVADGNPAPEVTWEKDNGEIPQNRTVTTPIGIAIDSVKLTDSGRYICKATNILGTTTKTIILVVDGKLTSA